jgi:hypothetical protein
MKPKECQSVVAAGASYGAAKQIMEMMYFGPAILLFGSALDAVGSNPDVSLAAALESTVDKFKAAKLMDDPDVVEVVKAAGERAQFDKVSAKLRAEFRDGLTRSARYTAKQIDQLVPEIIKATNDTRHRAMIGKFAWSSIPSAEGSYNVDTSTLTKKHEREGLFYRKPTGDSMMFGTDLLSSIVTAAQIGCAFALLPRLETYRRL